MDAEINESTTGADASVEALKLYHMKLTLAYSSLLALHDSDSLVIDNKWEMIAVIVAKKSSKSTNGRARLYDSLLLNVRTAAKCSHRYRYSFAALFSLLQLPIASVLVQS